MDSDRITTPYGAESTAAEVVKGLDLRGRRAIVTGGAAGIGVEIARALAGANAEVTLAVRDRRAGERTAADIVADTGNRRVLVAPLDLADPGSVAAFARAWDGPLHILVANAAVMATPPKRTARGWDLQFAVNHLGHFALATGLRRALAAAGGARVVSVSSAAHLDGAVVFGDIHFERRPYDRRQAYSQSKTANVLFAVEAAARWAGDGIAVNAVTPGRVRTRLTRHLGHQRGRPAAVAPSGAAPPWKTPEQGAATPVLAAASPLLDGVAGRYFEDCAEAAPRRPGAGHRGVAAYATDPERAARLWRVSSDLLAG